MSTNLPNDSLDADFFAAQRGDPDAFSRLVLATQRMVTSVALAITRDVQFSEDIAQETYLKAWHTLAAMAHPASLLPWLRHTTRNQAIDHVRRRRHREAPVAATDERLQHTADPSPGPDASMQRVEEAAVLARALDELPSDSREILLLFYREGQSSRQVAALLGLSDAAVRKRLQRARDVLQAGLLAQVGEVARHSAPGLAFTTLVASSLASHPVKASVAGAAGASAGKWFLGAIGSAGAAMAVVVAAVVWEARGYVRRARNPLERQQLIVHGVLYGVVMASFAAMLAWSNHHAWSFTMTLTVSAGYAVVIILLGVRRHRIHRRHRPSP